jgi:phenylacetate-CoA ligase
MNRARQPPAAERRQLHLNGRRATDARSRHTASPTMPDLFPELSLSLDAVRSLQLQRLRTSLRHAWQHQTPYRAKCDAAGVHPDDLRDLDDLARFPFTQKSDLRDNYPYGMFAVPRERCVRLHASSGTTGRPTVVGYTADDIGVWSDLMARSIWAAGGRPGDVVHVAYGYGLFTGGLGAHYGAERLGCTVVPMSGGFGERQVQLIREFGARVIMVTPSYMLALADEFDRQGVDVRDTALRIGIHGAEPWTEAMRAEIERRTGIDAVDIFGMSEVMGPGVAQEFVETKDGLTVWEDHFLPEIIDPQTGRRVADGQLGELVITSLSKQALPVIRYRTRDLTRLLPGSVTAMRRLARLTGRSDDMVIVRGVNLFPSQVEEQILKVDGLSPHYVLELSREGPLDSLSVVVEARSAVGDDGRAALAAALARRIKTMCGVTAAVRVADPGAVARSIGKAQRVIDKRPKP